MDDLTELPGALRGALNGLEERAARSARRVDAERVASRVLERLRAEPEAAPSAWSARRRVLRAVAVLAVLAAGAALVRQAVMDEPGRPAAVAVTTLADSLEVREAESLLAAVETFDVGPAAVPAVQPVSADDLTEAELGALLEAMQSDTEGDL